MSMVEKVARAICERHYSKRFNKTIDHIHVQMNVKANWTDFVQDARAAIEAMREPSPAMMEAFWEAGSESWGGTNPVLRNAVHEMMKAALA
jgi:hypothetical protein